MIHETAIEIAGLGLILHSRWLDFGRNQNGGLSRLQRFARNRLPGHAIDKHQAAFLFSVLDIPVNRVQIVIEAGSMSVSYPTDFINDRIVHSADSKRSSGVQIIGGLKPFALQTVSITGRITTLAK
ncbi:MAG: hypothetical protein U0744_00950 [Gemmataceae bacterium]